MNDPAQAALARAARRYGGAGRFARHYVAAKLGRDPVHRDVLALAGREPFGDVLDVGCGYGQLGLALLEAGGAHAVVGVDSHAGRLETARRAGAGLAFRAERRDLAQGGALPAADTVMLVDVLYQLDGGAQAALLAEVVRAARALVVVRTLDPERGWRSVLTWGVEVVGRRVWAHAGAAVNPVSVGVIGEALARAGFAVAVAPCWRGTPFANVLVVGRRARGSS